ncbi:MAG: hypothetical protein FWC27_05810 [Firmicutes bacterium]|nr:hypothetical protein [Bacillota bacterium]
MEILLCKEPCEREIANDYSGDVMNFHRPSVNFQEENHLQPDKHSTAPIIPREEKSTASDKFYHVKA